MTSTMRALVKWEPAAGLQLRDVPVPEISPEEILVRVRACSICGTDLHISKWDRWAQQRVSPPRIVGHEFCGEVVRVGDSVRDRHVGDYISAESHVICGTCAMCRTGRGHLCTATSILGVDRDGCFAEYVALPAVNAWVEPPDMEPEIASLMENFGNAVHTAFRADVRAKKVLVTGCGPVGLMSIAVARAIGSRSIYATDISPDRLDLAGKMGADLTFNAAREDVLKSVREATGGEGVDVLLEMSGAPEAVRQGFELVRPGGEVALLGLAGRPFEFDLDNLVIFKGLKVYGIVGRRLWQTWYRGRGLLRSGAVDLKPLVTHTFPLEEYEKAFDLMASGRCGKVILKP